MRELSDEEEEKLLTARAKRAPIRRDQLRENRRRLSMPLGLFISVSGGAILVVGVARGYVSLCLLGVVPILLGFSLVAIALASSYTCPKCGATMALKKTGGTHEEVFGSSDVVSCEWKCSSCGQAEWKVPGFSVCPMCGRRGAFGHTGRRKTQSSYDYRERLCMRCRYADWELEPDE